MQVNNVLNRVVQNGTVIKKVEEEKSFKNCIEEKQKEIECNDLKTGKKGELYGLVNNQWQNLNIDMSHTRCGPNEIVVIGDPEHGLVKIGENVLANLLDFRMANRTPYAVTKDLGFSDMLNGLALIPGRTARLIDGTILEWTKNGVDFIPRKTNNDEERTRAENYARSIAMTMDRFTRVANRQALGVGNVIGITKEKTKEISNVLNAMGINTNGDFHVNGKQFRFDSVSGEFKYTFDNSIDGKYGVRYVNLPTIKLV